MPYPLLLALLACTGAEEGPPPPDADEVLKTAARTADNGSLVLSQIGLTDALLEAVLADERIPALESVTLHENRLTADAVGILERSGKLSEVKWLNLSHNDLGPDGARALLASPLLASVERLFISGSGAGPEGLVGLASAAPALTYLAAGDQPLGDAGAQALAGLGQLSRLELPRAEIGGAGARALIAGTGARVLVLEGNALGGGLVGLTQISPSLEELTLDSCALTRRDVEALSALPAPERLKLLELSGNPALAEDGIAALAEIPWLRSLEKLVVMESGASLEHRQAVVDAWGVRSGIKIERR